MEVSSAHCPPEAPGRVADTQTDKPGETSRRWVTLKWTGVIRLHSAMHVHGAVRKKAAFSLLSQGYSGIIYKQ